LGPFKITSVLYGTKCIELRTREIDDIGIIDVLGIDGFSHEEGEFKRALAALLAKGKRKILVNMGNERDIGGQQIGELIMCSEVARENSATLALTGVCGRAYELLVITKLIKLFKVFRDETEAIKSFS
jgi:anti-anti-sigma regulatory factor